MKKKLPKATRISGRSSFTKTCKSKKQSFSLGAKMNRSGKLTYKSSSPKKVKVSKKGRVTIAKGFVGTARITVKAKGTSDYGAATKVVKVTVSLAKPKLKKVTSPVSGGIRVSWGSVAGADYCTVYISEKPSFPPGGTRMWDVYTKSSLDVADCVSGKRYYVRVVAGVNSSNATGTSSTKSVKVK